MTEQGLGEKVRRQALFRAMKDRYVESYDQSLSKGTYRRSH